MESDQFSIDQWLDELPIRTISSPEGLFFYAQDLGNVLGIKRVSSMISRSNSRYTEKDIVTSEQRTKHNLITYKRHKNGDMCVDNTIVLLTELGARKLIFSSRSPAAEQIRRKLNYELGYYPTVLEANFIDNMRTVFVGEEFITQYPVLDYRIDLYMPKYNLAIEFDESGHKYRSEDDAIRQDAIECRLGCTFIRVKDMDNHFAAAGRIYAHIHTNYEAIK